MNEHGNGSAEQLRLMRRQSALLTGIAVLLAVMAAAFFSLRRWAGEIDMTLKQMDMEAFNRAVTSMDEAADRLSGVDVDGLNATAASLKAAADNLSSVDMESLNSAVKSLSGAAENLKGVDVSALNRLVQSLETVSDRLEKAVSAIGGLFGR